MIKFTPNVKWLDGAAITAIDYNYLTEKMIIFYKLEGGSEFEEIQMGTDFKPFIHYSKGSNKYDQVKHGDSYKSIKAVKATYEQTVLLPPETQFLIQTGKKLYDGIGLSDMKIIVFDIETTSLDPEEGEILSIGIHGNYDFADGKRTVLLTNEMSEMHMLLDFIDFMKVNDPDILVGHNVFEFDIPYIEHRMMKKKIAPNIGRCGLPMYKNFYSTKINRLIAGSDFFQYIIPGRHVVDTMHLAMNEDIRRREFESYGLKYLAQYLGVAPKDRVYLEGDKIAEMYKTDREKFIKYLEGDLEETMGLMKLMLPAYFHMCKIIPITLQNQIYAGATRKFTALFVGDYYEAGKGLPMAQETRKFQGATTDTENIGIYYNVAKYDVSSLYPSTMRYRNMVPKSDELGVFMKYLIKFMDERLEYKYKAEEVEGKDEKLYEEYYAYQLALKILINSFYGVLGTGGFIFNDFDAAESITAYGRKVLLAMKDFLEKNKCTPIEMDTDGIYFIYPKDTDPNVLLEELNKEMESGIKVDFEKKFRSMISYMSKTYVLMPEAYPKKKIKIAGSAFRKRGMHPFLKKWLATSFEKLLTHDIKGYEDNSFLLKRAIGQRELALVEVVESKKISYDYKHYTKRAKQVKIAHFEAMRKEGKENDYKAGSKVSLYYAGDKITKQKSDMVKLYVEGDENTENDYNVDSYLNMLKVWEDKLDIFYKQIKNENQTVEDNKKNN